MIRSVLEIWWRAIIRIFAFIGKETQIILHQPRLVFSLILGPFLILLLFGLGYQNEPRTLNTLFVVPEGSTIGSYVEQYANSIGNRIEFAGITHDPAAADQQLRQQKVDLVVVTPRNPLADWENDEQSTFSLFHNEIDPLEVTYVQVIGQQYAERLNQELLLKAVSQSQQETSSLHDDIAQAKANAAAVRTALASGNTAAAQNSVEDLQRDLDFMTLALGSGMALMSGVEQAGGQDAVPNELLSVLETLQNQTDEMAAATQDNTAVDQGQTAATEMETSLDKLDNMLQVFQETDPAVLVTPFQSKTLSITQATIEPLHFYVPAVIALLLQHLAITLAGLSIINEKLSGAMEMFRAGPVSAFEMLFGKYTSYMLLIGVLAAVLTGLIVWGLRVPQLGLWANYVLVLLALLLASLGIGFNISLSARSRSQAIQYGMLTLLAAIFFSGFFLPLYRLAMYVRIVSWLLPATYGTVMLKNVMLRGQAPGVLLLVVLSGMALVLFLLAWFRLGRQLKRE
ncbi:MAG: ABC transporter permease [Ardenticatenaceae bacterium]|nr:ABC transporter permease [Anaerolineales bacterium]MCB8985523.1 ABC transporter permease [Ardenticatenaceae bacterium]MCB8988709.1 ABC transporter permease [Ardenticatenaceae bacterium]